MLVLCFTVTVLLIACKENQLNPQEKVTKIFFAKKNFFDSIVYKLRFLQLRNDSVPSGSSYLEGLQKRDIILFNELISTGITDLIIYYRPGCKKVEHYDFKTDWGSNNEFYIDYNSCDSLETKKGYYRKDEKGNEFWGLGDSWKMWKLVEYLDHKQ